MRIKKSKTVKKVCVTALAAVCALTSVSAISAGAKTTQYAHTVNVGGYSGANDATWITIEKSKEYCYDLYPSYPNVLNKKNSTVIQSRAEKKGSKDKTTFKSVTLQKTSPTYPVASYGNLLKGQWRLYYKYVSGGGFKGKVTTYERY